MTLPALAGQPRAQCTDQGEGSEQVSRHDHNKEFHWGTRMRIQLLLIAVAILPSCAVVTIEGASGPQRLINVGALTVLADQPNRAIVSTARGIGVTAHNGILNLGYIDHEMVQILEPTECNLVLIIKSSEEAEQIKRKLGEVLGDACTKSDTYQGSEK